MAIPGDSMPDEAVAWTCHPVRHRPLAGVLAALFVVAAVAGVQLWLRIPLLTAVGGFILVLSVLPFYLPTRYRLGEDEIEIRGLLSARTQPWSKFRSCYADRRGALLTPFPRPSRLDRLVGLNLRFDDPDRDRVLAEIRRRVGERVAAHAGA